jgi:hypothetical protein
MYVIKAMIMDKPDLLVHIIKTICENCSPREDLYQTIGEYTNNEIYRTVDFIRNEDGSLKLNENGEPTLGAPTVGKKYFYSVPLTNNKYISDWAVAVREKTKEYFKNL